MRRFVFAICLATVSAVGAGDSPRRMVVEGARAAPGGVVEVRVTGGADFAVAALSFALGHDAAVLELLAVRIGRDLEAAGVETVVPVVNNGAAMPYGALFVVVDDCCPMGDTPPVDLSAGGELAVLEYRVRQDAPLGPTVLDLRHWYYGEPRPIHCMYGDMHERTYVPELVSGEVVVTLDGPVPVIQAVAPSRGPVSGGTVVLVSGENLDCGGQATVWFGSVEGQVLSAAPVAISVLTPPVALPGPVAVRVRTGCGESALPEGFTYELQSYFIRGDANADASIDIGDPVAILAYLFAGRSLRCLDAADANDDGSLDIADPVRILAYLFAGAPGLSPPFPDLGPDPTPDNLDCEDYR